MLNSLRWFFAAAALLGALTMPQLASSRDFDNHFWNDRFDNDHRQIKHVFVITLENEGYDETFGANSKAPYLSQTLPAKGALLTQYFGTGHASLDNYIAMISGQAATNETRADCQIYADFQLTGITPDGQAIGSGCVYPSIIKTLPDQLKAARKTWHAYIGDMGNDPGRESSTCGHPALNTADLTQTAEAPSAAYPQGDQYAARHNPFVYFHSIIDSTDCAANVVNLNRLPQDLSSESTTPNFVFITPNLCDDGHDGPCVTGQPGGLVSADQFLQKWVPVITSSPAFKRDGLLVINFDEGGYTLSKNASGGYVITFLGDSCCSEQPGPNLGSFPQSNNVGSYTLVEQNFGGDRTGAVLLSPFIKPGTVSNTPFNHYSLLKTVEDIFSLDHLGYAGQPGLLSFFGCVSSDVVANTGDQFAECKVDDNSGFRN
jgi:hypothetical protein